MSDDRLKQLNALLGQGIVILQTLNSLLDEEMACLPERNLERMQSLVTDKEAQLRALYENNQARSQLMSELGFEASVEGMQQLLEQQPEAIARLLGKQWQALQDGLAQVQSANQRNHQVVSRNQRNLDQLLSVLQGQKPQNKLYTNAGSSTNRAPQSRIGKA